MHTERAQQRAGTVLGGGWSANQRAFARAHRAGMMLAVNVAAAARRQHEQREGGGVLQPAARVSGLGSRMARARCLHR